MKPRWHTLWRAAAVSTDAIAVSAALGVAAALRFGIPALPDTLQPALELEFLTAPILVAVPIWLLSFALLRLYNPLRCENAVDEMRRLVTGSLGAAVGLVFFGFLLKEPPSRLWLVSGTALGVLSTVASRRALRWGVASARRRGRYLEPTVVVGRREAKRVVEAMLSDPGSGYLPVAACGFDDGVLPHHELDRLPEAVAASRASTVLVVADDLERDEVRGAVSVADVLPVRIMLLPGLDFTLMHTLHLTPVCHEPALSLELPSLRAYQRATKRAMDVVLSSVFLALSLPVMAVVWAAVRLDSPGPAIFRQRRVGHLGSDFEMLKFRTMVVDADDRKSDLLDANEADGVLFKLRDDPRLTRVGRFLRRFSLDEIPQLWNVLRGDMSLVGPRPAVPEEVEQYDLTVRRRLNVRPGVTGLWQIKGRSVLPFEEYVRLDVTYVQSWNILLDIFILARTVPAVLSGRGAY